MKKEVEDKDKKQSVAITATAAEPQEVPSSAGSAGADGADGVDGALGALGVVVSGEELGSGLGEVSGAEVGDGASQPIVPEVPVSPVAPVAQMGDMSLAERYATELGRRGREANEAVNEATQSYNASQERFKEHHQSYVDGRRNPVADLINKPQRAEAKEKRLRQVAMVSMISDAIGLIGKGYAASKGAMPVVSEGRTIFNAMDELSKLDDIYLSDGLRYDERMIAEALRREQVEGSLQAMEVDSAAREVQGAQQRAMGVDKEVSEYYTALQKRGETQAQRRWEEEQDAAERKWREGESQKERNARASIANANRSSKGSGGNVSSTMQKMVLIDPKTGERVIMYAGEYNRLWGQIREDNPGKAGTVEDIEKSDIREVRMGGLILEQRDKESAQRAAETQRQESKSNLRPQITRLASVLKSNGYSSTTLGYLKNQFGDLANGLNDKEIIEMFAAEGFTVNANGAN